MVTLQAWDTLHSKKIRDAKITKYISPTRKFTFLKIKNQITLVFVYKDVKNPIFNEFG